MRSILTPAVIIGSLGYLVDIFDLFIFSIVRIQSLAGLGVPEKDRFKMGLLLLDAQMAGLILGGIAWGILGDRRGRKTVLFGSIFIYSLANILNAGVQDVTSYAILRFVAGFGLAGELGAAITLVTETLPKEKRGTGTAIVTAVGVLGALAAAVVGEILPWRQAYLFGGILGLTLFALRFRLEESEHFKTIRTHHARADLRILLRPFSRAKRYFSCILVGLPMYFVIGILITFSPEFAKELGIQGPVTSANAVFYSTIGATFGDLFGGLCSQWFKTRKKVIAVILCLHFLMIVAYLTGRNSTPQSFYWVCGFLGVTTGYWAVLITLSAEQFGTNIRATVATSVPNFVRGSVIPMSLLFGLLRSEMGLVPASLALAVLVTLLAHYGLWGLEETYGKDIYYLESR